MKILIVSKCPTHPTNAGNRWGILAQAKILEKLGAEVHFLYVEERALNKKRIAEFDDILDKTSKYWGDKFYHYKIPVWLKVIYNIKKRWFAYRNKRANCDSYFPNGLIGFVNRIDNKIHFDVCIVNYYYLTKLFKYIHIQKKAVFTHDNYTYKDIRLGCRPGECDNTADANEMAKAMQRSPHIFAVQDEEAIFFQQLSPLSKIYTIYSKYEYKPQPIVNNKNILFLSGNNGYNINGIRWFVRNVFPLIKKQYPDAQLIIGGAICNVIEDLKDIDGIKLLGFIDNLSDFYSLGDIAINPVYQGTGLKIKTFEAISYDKVTLVHPHSMAGIYNKSNAPLFSSENPKEWISFLKKIWTSPDYIKQIKEHNKKYIQEMNEFIQCEYKKFLSKNEIIKI